METVEISFDLTSTDYSAELGFSVTLDEKTIIDILHVDKETPVTLKIAADDGDQELKFTMKNKTANHTTVDENGQVVKDAYLNISNFYLKNIKLGDIFLEHCKYRHDFNGTQDPVVVPFYGDIGCNGTIVFLFQSPAYYWILETIPYRKSNYV
jgi:hypothetical protein